MSYSTVSFSQKSLSKTNVYQKYDAENYTFGIGRENFEDFIERKRNERLKYLAKKCHKAQKKKKQYQKQIDQILKVNKKVAIGPQWFQELSDKQMDTLHSLSERIKEVNDQNTSKITKQMLKTLGVTTFIPLAVTKNAILNSELDPVSYLTAIKDFVMSKSEMISEKDQQNEDYSPEIRILMSSILYLAYPNLIEKLDICLSAPEPDHTQNNTHTLTEIELRTRSRNRNNKSLEFLQQDGTNKKVDGHTASSSNHDRDGLTEEPQSMYNLEDKSTLFDDILAILRQLPDFKQLQEVLKFLSILGDPVAGFPNLIELRELRRWYEKRLKIDKHMTPKMKKNLLNNSVKAWHSPRTLLSSVTVPQNPIKQNRNAEKITWDHVTYVKQTIHETKTNYTSKLKHVAVNNAREMYTTMENFNYKNKMNRNFRQTFFDYFPAKEDDCLLYVKENTYEKI